MSLSKNPTFINKSSSRPLGISAFVRCKNEEEYIVASLMSAYRVFDEIVVVLNNSTDKTSELIEDLMRDHPKIKLMEYMNDCIPAGEGYFEKTQARPDGSLARYYNWCLEQTKYSHVCKWDGDMIAIAPLEQVRDELDRFDVVMFDGYDVLSEYTTSIEARIFRYNPSRARYIDWDLYEILEHDYSAINIIKEKCYVHMKLVKKEWLHKQWECPNLTAKRSVPETGVNARGGSSSTMHGLGRFLRGTLHRLRYRQ